MRCKKNIFNIRVYYVFVNDIIKLVKKTLKVSDYMHCMIETAFDNLDEAKQVIFKLLDEKLVASCQMVECNSKWNWKQEIEESKEYLVFMKTNT